MWPKRITVFWLFLLSGVTHACSYATAEYVSHGSSEADLPPIEAAPDVRFESFERFPGVAGTSCDGALSILTLSVSPSHLRSASIVFEALPGGTTGSPIPAGSYTTDLESEGRLQLIFLADFYFKPGHVPLRVFTVSPTGRRSKPSELRLVVPEGGL
jgi:hypothetical protein